MKLVEKSTGKLYGYVGDNKSLRDIQREIKANGFYDTEFQRVDGAERPKTRQNQK